MVVQNTGNTGVFFDEQVVSTIPDNLISAQVDPSQPQVNGLSTTTMPLVTDRTVASRLAAFDPDQFDLSDSSVLMRLITALVAGAGIGGLRRQQIISRMSMALAGTNFTELDSFWGKLFHLSRSPDEQLPTNDSGTPLDPSSDVTDSVTWDAALARDGHYRSRIEQLAKGFALGATYDGIRMAASAILNADVEIVESWVYADYADDGSVGFTSNTWQAVAAQYTTWGALDGVPWGTIALGAGSTTANLTPLGNRGEITIIPGRAITQAERYQLHLVMDHFAPAGTMVTIATQCFVTEQEIDVRSVGADSVDWDVTSSVGAHPGLATSGIDLYPNASDYESARPAFGRYSGERWSYNGQVGLVTAYALEIDGTRQSAPDYQSVSFADGTGHDYVPTDALVDSRRLALAKAASEGVATVFPYAEGRISS